MHLKLYKSDSGNLPSLFLPWASADPFELVQLGTHVNQNPINGTVDATTAIYGLATFHCKLCLFNGNKSISIAMQNNPTLYLINNGQGLALRSFVY